MNTVSTPSALTKFFVPVILEEVDAKYCKPGEHIVHEYYVQGLRSNGKIQAFRRSLYTEEYTLTGDDFICTKFLTKAEAEAFVDDVKRYVAGGELVIREMTSDEIFKESTACLKRA